MDHPVDVWQPRVLKQAFFETFWSAKSKVNRSLSVPNLLFIDVGPQNNSFQYFSSPAAPYRNDDNDIFSKQKPSPDPRERLKADKNYNFEEKIGF